MKLLWPFFIYIDKICIKIGNSPIFTNGFGVLKELFPNLVPKPPAKITTGSVDSSL